MATLALLVGLAPAALGRTVFGDHTAVVKYGVSIEFVQPVEFSDPFERPELLLEFPGALGPVVAGGGLEGEVGSWVLRYELRIAETHLLPNTTITARWRLTDADGALAVGPPVTVRYEDTRFEWRTREGDVVRVHWYEGTDAFGDRALAIGERAVRETAELLGVTEDEPIDFFVYADQDEFYDALGPGTRENVGGQANAEIRTLFALITPGEIDDPWVDIVIPHELVHLVFDTAVDNPYHFPPRWLNEGLAMYLSQGYAVDDRLRVEGAAKDGSLIPLDGLTTQFPTTREQFFLAYAESVSAVDFLIRTHSREALIGLIKSYARGVTDDEAFEAALGVDVAAFDEAWRNDLDAVEPTVYGPQPAPPGPVPPGWLGPDGSPVPTVAPGGPVTSPHAGDPSAPRPNDTEGSPTWLWIALGLLGGVAIVAGLLWRRRRTPPEYPPPEYPPAP